MGTCVYRRAAASGDNGAVISHGAVDIDRDGAHEVADGQRVVSIPRAQIVSLRIAHGFVSERIPLMIAMGAALCYPAAFAISRAWASGAARGSPSSLSRS